MTATELRLEDIANIQMGYQARAGIAENLDAEYSVLRALDIDDGGLNFSGAMRFSPGINAAPYLISSGDILLVARGQNHLAHLVQEAPANAVASNSFYIVRLLGNTALLPEYLVWWLNAPEAQTYFAQQQGRSTIPFLSKKALGACMVRVPPLEVQARIGNIINLARRERALTRQLAEKKNILIEEVCRKAARHSSQANA
ncbi:MAG: restriction endonuclease subunit S [Anaerolineae bacterium]|nr:MAG: restriction endonuclease subunit S [Anaerolineae bacterium]